MTNPRQKLVSHVYEDAWAMLGALCARLREPGSALAHVSFAQGEDLSGFHASGPEMVAESFAVRTSALGGPKPEGMPDSVWSLLQSPAGAELVGGAVERGVPIEDLGRALPGLCVHNPAGMARLNLAVGICVINPSITKIHIER